MTDSEERAWDKVSDLEDKVKQLEAQIKQLAYLHSEDVDTIKLLNERIKKMKNCKNCKKLKKEKDGLLICTVGSFCTNTFGKNCDKWEIKEE